MPMYKVSNLSLAISVSESGCLPSFMADNYESIEQLSTDILEFKSKMNNQNFMLCIDLEKTHFNKLELINFILDMNIKCLDIISTKNKTTISIIKHFKEKNIKIGTRVFKPFKSILFEIIDFILVKGPKSAGYINNGEFELINILQEMKLKYPNLSKIACGGISNKQDIDSIKHLCDGIGIGTLFALSKESSISDEIKLKLIENKNNVSKIIGFNGHQNAISFSKIEGEKNTNNTKNLINGLTTGNGGHIFVGHGIQNVDEILSVEEIVQSLVKNTFE